jgi:hypothetical protein
LAGNNAATSPTSGEQYGKMPKTGSCPGELPMKGLAAYYYHDENSLPGKRGEPWQLIEQQM